MDLDDTGNQVSYLIRDRDGKYPALFDTILADARIGVVLSGSGYPGMNSIMSTNATTISTGQHDRLGGHLHEYDRAA